MSEETKEYLKRVDELELKLTGDDKDTFQWVLFGYNECARILEETEQENQQLSNELRIKNEELRIKGKVLDEIREYINNTFTISSVKDMYKIMDGIEEILDKVKE